MVILLHVAGAVYVKLGPQWWAGNVYDSLVRSSVPIFFMLAGMTLLRRDEPLGTFFGKRAWRILPPLLFWSLFYLWWLWYNGIGPANWVLAMLTGPTMYHLWYFYAIIGIYLAVPVLRKFYTNASRREHQWFLLVWLAVASLIPTAQAVLFNPHCEGYIRFDRLNDIYHLAYFGGYFGFLVLGAYIADGQPSRRLGWSVFLGASVATMLGNHWMAQAFGTACEFLFVYLSPFVIAAAWGLFSAVMAGPKGEAPRWLATLSDCTLGIYGLHVFVIDPVFLRRGWSATTGNPWVSTILVAAGVFVTCFVVVFLLRLVKPLRRII